MIRHDTPEVLDDVPKRGRGAEAQISEGAEGQMKPDLRENDDITISEGGRAIGQRDILYSERSKSKGRAAKRKVAAPA